MVRGHLKSDPALGRSLEPEGLGATAGVIARQRGRCLRLDLDRVTVVNADFNEWQTNDRFDVILSRNSIDRSLTRKPETISGGPSFAHGAPLRCDLFLSVARPKLENPSKAVRQYIAGLRAVRH
jgi:hypothetical protein